MKLRPMTVLVATVAAVALFAAACGGSTDDTSKESGKDSTTTTAAAAADAPTDADIKALTATAAGGGASFPDAFYQAVNTDFNGVAGKELVTYAKSGSSDGRKQLAEQTLQFAGSDSLPKPEETFKGGEILFFPTVAAPITVSYNLSGVTDLQLSPDTLAGIMSTDIKVWNDPKIAADNPKATLPSTPIVVVHRSDGSGTTNNFTKYLVAAAPNTWKLGSGDTVAWPAGTQGAEKNSGVAQLIKQTAGAVGYVDLADSQKAGLSVAAVKDQAGEYVKPTADGVKAALENAEVADNLTYNPLNSKGKGAYPITAPTWLITYAKYTDAALVSTLQTYLRYVLTTGQSQAQKVGYVGIPESLQTKALAQVDKITAG